jgi:hypothetical protein
LRQAGQQVADASATLNQTIPTARAEIHAASLDITQERYADAQAALVRADTLLFAADTAAASLQPVAPVIQKAATNVDALAAENATLKDEVKKAQDKAESSALLWMMLIGGGLLVAGAVCAYLFKSLTIAIVGLIAGGGLILVSRLLSAVDHFIIDNPVLAGLIAVGVILAVVAVIGWKGGWFFKKRADQTGAALTSTITAIEKAPTEVAASLKANVTAAALENRVADFLHSTVQKVTKAST